MKPSCVPKRFRLSTLLMGSTAVPRLRIQLSTSFLQAQLSTHYTTLPTLAHGPEILWNGSYLKPCSDQSFVMQHKHFRILRRSCSSVNYGVSETSDAGACHRRRFNLSNRRWRVSERRKKLPVVARCVVNLWSEVGFNVSA